MYQRDLYVLKTVVARGIPIATVIGGGYSSDVDKLAVRHSIVHRAATQVHYLTESNIYDDILYTFFKSYIYFFVNQSRYELQCFLCVGLERMWNVEIYEGEPRRCVQVMSVCVYSADPLCSPSVLRA